MKMKFFLKFFGYGAAQILSLDLPMAVLSFHSLRQLKHKQNRMTGRAKCLLKRNTFIRPDYIKSMIKNLE